MIPLMRVRTSATEHPADRRLREYGAVLLAVAMGLIWTWWAFSDGSFFGSALYPGTIVLYAVLAIALAFLPFRILSGGPHEGAILALLLLALWTFASLAWTPARDQALEDALRTLAYAASMFAGLWLANLLRERMVLAALPLIIAGGTVTLATAAACLISAPADVLDGSARLDYPFGYTNAAAGFAATFALAAIAFATQDRLPRLAGSALVGLATLAIGLTVMSQSRGVTLGLAIAFVVLVGVAARRARAVAGSAMAIGPLLPTLPLLLAPATSPPADLAVDSELQLAVAAAIVASIAAGCLAWLALPQIPDRIWLQRRALPRWAIASIAVGVLAFGGAGAALISGKLAEDSGSLEYSDPGGSRLLYTGGLGRADFWRVAFSQFEDSPVLGGGAGSFRSAYLLDRDTDEQPRDAHGIGPEFLGELGLPGLVFLTTALCLLVVAGLRSRSLGPRAAALTTIAFSAGAVWFTQAMIDWSWAFPALTAPVLALLAAAGAPAALSPRDGSGRRLRRSLIPLLVGLSLLTVPLYISERNTFAAAERFEADPEGAYDALDVAARLNPLTDTPLLLKADIARRQGDADIAIDALEQARGREPDEWRNYLIAARVLAGEDPAAALTQVELALELNPRAAGLRRLGERLERRADQDG